MPDAAQYWSPVPALDQDESRETFEIICAAKKHQIHQFEIAKKLAAAIPFGGMRSARKEQPNYRLKVVSVSNARDGTHASGDGTHASGVL